MGAYRSDGVLLGAVDGRDGVWSDGGSADWGGALDVRGWGLSRSHWADGGVERDDIGGDRSHFGGAWD